MVSDPAADWPKSAGAIVGVSPPIRRVFRLIHQVSAYGYPVFVCGERGSGRELAARTIHHLSPRRDQPFVVLDCSILAPTLLKAELFGYGRGAFFGASETKWGLLALAGQGTLFLDHIAHLPLGLQAEVMRVLQQSKFTPLGSTYALPFKARVIAANLSDLQLRVKAGAFREDLFVAVNVRQIQIPPLRERVGDISILAGHFIVKHRASQQSELACSDSARKFLEAYEWPGNVGELENTIRRAVAGAQGPVLRLRDVRLALRDESIAAMVVPAGMPAEEAERLAIVRALSEAGGDKTLAAHRLGMGRAALSKRLKYHNVFPGFF